jgi:Iap family predicted aminopeptidase
MELGLHLDFLVKMYTSQITWPHKKQEKRHVLNNIMESASDRTKNYNINNQMVSKENIERLYNNGVKTSLPVGDEDNRVFTEDFIKNRDETY